MLIDKDHSTNEHRARKSNLIPIDQLPYPENEMVDFIGAEVLQF